jgi:hypothetical protein
MTKTSISRFPSSLNQILGGDSQDPKSSKHNKKTPADAARVTCDRMATPLGTGIVFNIIGLSFVFLCVNFFFVFCFVLFMHCIKFSHASHVLIFESTHKLQVTWGTSSLPYDF